MALAAGRGAVTPGKVTRSPLSMAAQLPGPPNLEGSIHTSLLDGCVGPAYRKPAPTTNALMGTSGLTLTARPTLARLEGSP
jgi:hypothetical protein